MKKLLYEVSIIRPIIIILLLFMHSFTAYTGSWPAYDCMGTNDFYYLICKFITGFMLEAFVFISAYVFSYQCNSLNKNYKFIPFIKKKFIHLYVPCLFFGIIYYFIFINEGNFDKSKFADEVTKGCGHLWFLPMLFWNFIFIWLIDKYKPNKIITFIILSLLSVYPFHGLYLGLTRSIHYALYMYIGYQMWNYKGIILEKMKNNAFLYSFCAIYIFAVLAKTYFDIYIPSNGKIVIMAFSNSLLYLTSITGIMALYLAVCRITETTDYKPSEFVLNLSAICYGMYIFHQFILKYLLYKTSLPCMLGQLTPWVCFAITVCTSYLLTKLFMRFKFGRLLIG